MLPQKPKTYHIGLTQAKSYRILKRQTDISLLPFNITSTEWGFLGLVADNKKGFSSSLLAKELGVSSPFISRVISKLENLDYIKKIKNNSDGRGYFVMLTTKGEQKVKEIEKVLRKEMRYLVRGTTTPYLLAYKNVLETINKNGGHLLSAKNNKKLDT